MRALSADWMRIWGSLTAKSAPARWIPSTFRRWLIRLTIMVSGLSFRL